MAHDLPHVEPARFDKLRLFLILAGPLLVVAGVVGGDRLIAETTGRDMPGAAALYGVVDILDLASGKDVSNFLLGAVLIVLALAVNLWKRRRLLSGALIYVGLVQFLSTTIADLSKPIFGRARPFQAIADGRWTDLWFAGPDYGSFPSGHVAFYIGLCVPIAILHRKLAAPLLLVPAVVAIQRMSSHDHYMTDVGASALLGVVLALMLLRLLRPRGEVRAVSGIGSDQLMASDGVRERER